LEYIKNELGDTIGEKLGVKIVRLLSGEELLAEVTIDYAKIGPTLKAPVIIHIVPDPVSQKANIAMTDWLPYMATDTVDINSTAVVTIVDPQEPFIEYWNKNFGQKKSNLIVPKKPGLVGVK